MSSTEQAAEPGEALMDIEPALHDMRNATAMLGHMATSDAEVLTEHLHFIEDRLIAAHRQLAALWAQAWEDRKAEHAKHAAELAEAEARAKESAPGSVHQIKRVEAMLGLLRHGHSVAQKQCGEMAEQIAEVLAEREAEPA